MSYKCLAKKLIRQFSEDDALSDEIYFVRNFFPDLFDEYDFFEEDILKYAIKYKHKTFMDAFINHVEYFYAIS